MARTAKKKELSIEEKLAAALVPEEEQPYKVPENWCWVNIASVNFFAASSVNPTQHPEKTYELYSVPSYDEEYPEIIIGEKIGSTKQSVIKDDVLLCKINPRINRVWKVAQYTDNELLASSEWIVIRNTHMNSDYLVFWLKSPCFREYMLTNVSGVGGSLMRAKPKYVRNYPVPISPIDEQQRIVSTIESLFADLNEAKAKLQTVLNGFAERKAAILHQAFTGELTREWREEHGESLSSWDEKNLDEVCLSIFDGDHMPPPKSETGIPFLVISNVSNGKLSYENTRFVPHEYYNELSETRKPQLGDVLYTLVGTYGIPVIVDDERPFCFQRHMALLKPKAIETRFLWYLLQTQEMYQKASSIATGTAQMTVPIKGLRKLQFNCPPQSEQKVIVHILDHVLGNEQQAKSAVKSVLADIDTMKKSILARAFRGELGTGDKKDESAVSLLRQILQQIEA